ncbi:MAG: hypothetical protein GYA24_11970 [Candidatus Lokiarchaeota archaeon]|nr:hypothetical protein [Candidatus Lokiarchaeota archaeon]
MVKFDIARVETVLPMKHAREVLESFHQAGSLIVYLTGRMDDQLKEITDTWLVENSFVGAGSVVYFQSKHGPWTWKNYLRFKIVEARRLARRHPGYLPVIVDDNEDVVKRARKAGFHVALVRQPADWIALQEKYLRSRVVVQLEDFASSSTSL